MDKTRNWSQDLARREINLRKKTLTNIKDQLISLLESLNDEILELNVKLDRLEKETK